MGIFVVGIFGAEFRGVNEYAAETETQVVKTEICGEASCDLDKIKGFHRENGQWYLAQAAPSCDES